jgi:4-amino-4-deoxy-L-arabinose transferase-like glycosyltransferase
MTRLWLKIFLFVLAFVILAELIVHKPTRNLQDFDEPFYVTLAYDLDKYHVFSNGPFSGVDDTSVSPPAGMFFGPVYPLLVLAAMQLDSRFAAAVHCAVEANRGHRDIATCDPYDLPMRLLNALLLAVATVAIASTAELIFARRLISALTGIAILVALSFESDIFSYVMTESTIFAIYSLVMLAAVSAWRTGRPLHFIFTGVLLGVLSLTKPSYLILFPIIVLLSLLYLQRLAVPRRPHAIRAALVLSLGFCCVVGAWCARNAYSVGKLALTEEYGSTSLIERFAYDDMTPREFLQAFPYCTPGIGDLAFDIVYGTDSMHRFTYHTSGSFFQVGRARREALIAQHGKLDPHIVGIAGDEMRTNWWRYLLVSIPLAWCGLWAGRLASLVMVPAFAWACVCCVRGAQPLFLLYAAPAVMMLGLDALVGNHFTRYNLILMGPYAIGTAFIISSWLQGPVWPRREQLHASEPLSAPSASEVSSVD